MKFFFKCLFLALILLFKLSIPQVVKFSNLSFKEYVAHFNYQNKSFDISSLLGDIVQKLEGGQNIIFTKFGDGECACMRGQYGHNCDNDTYHDWLGQALKDALINLSQKPNTYIGRWWSEEVYKYCDHLAIQKNIIIPWVWYHLFLNDDKNLKFSYMFDFVRFIITTKRKKILLANKLNERLKDFFKVNVFIELPLQNWSFEYKKWKNLLEKEVEKDAVILIAGGMCSKVLIADISDKYDLTFIDIGSSFDLLARKQKSRTCNYSYEDVFNYYKNLLPPDWD